MEQPDSVMEHIGSIRVYIDSSNLMEQIRFGTVYIDSTRKDIGSTRKHTRNTSNHGSCLARSESQSKGKKKLK